MAETSQQSLARTQARTRPPAPGQAASLTFEIIPAQLLTKERRLYGVIVIAFAFLVAELVIGFTNNALVLVADAFHISSDLIGYIVSVICIRLASKGDPTRKREGFTFGLQRAEVLGAAFNGVFLLALGVSVILQSVDRFINPSEIDNAVLVAIIGGAGIASNLIMLALLGLHSHSHSHDHATTDNVSGGGQPGEHVHAAHAHSKRQQPKKRRFDLNILGVLLHILGDGINSVAVIISAVVYLKTGWIYMDPIASLFGKLNILVDGSEVTLRKCHFTLQSGS